MFRRFLLYYVRTSIDDTYYLNNVYGSTAADTKMYMVRKQLPNSTAS